MYYIKIIVGSLAALVTWSAFCVYGALQGWWLTPIAEKGEAAEFSVAAQKLLRSEFSGNSALVIIENGVVIMEDYQASIDDIDKNTLFPMASMSKLFSAYGIHTLAQKNALDLNASVGNYLSRWQFPETDFDNSLATMTSLLAHTSGLTDGLGFGDYTKDEDRPSLEESLFNPRASNGPASIELGTEPGSQWNYSGGGYLVAELVVEEITKQTFKNWMKSKVFTPLGMTRATYDYLGSQINHTKTYYIDGKTAPIYQYASNAATGLNLSPADLIIFAKALMSEGPLDEQAIATMREPLGKTMGAAIWGPGAMRYAPTESNDTIFGHDGANEPAINTSLRVNPDNKNAIIVLTTGHPTLASQIGSEWTLWQTGKPDFLSIDAALASAAMTMASGSFLILAIAVILTRRMHKRLTSTNA